VVTLTVPLPAQGLGGGASNCRKLEPPPILSGPDPQYTSESLRRQIEGCTVVRCVVTVAGAVTNCRSVVSLPELTRAAVEALQQRRYRPASCDGVPIEVDYTFRMVFRLPL
jgi:TonB family protein